MFTYADLWKLAEMPDFARRMEAMCDDGSIMEWLPEAFWLDNYLHKKAFHPEGNPLEHTLCCLKIADARAFDPLSKIAVLFHDIGKASCADGYDAETHPYHRFYGHEMAGLSVFRCVAKRLGIPKSDSGPIAFCIRYHMRAHKFREMRVQKVLETVCSPHWEVLKKVSYADSASRAGLFNEQELLDSFAYAEGLKRDAASQAL
ncbi:MAG: HD domain-containing protein [Desulfovibrionaceae bacterium]|nr:HD domain-containing protein [Desulfovibrionaceae bacterium]